MILGVNGLRLIGDRSGVARAIESVLGCFDHVEHPFDEVRVYSPRPLPSAVTLPRVARNVVLHSALPPALWEQVVLPRAHGARDLLFCPSYVIPLAARCPTLLVHHGSYEGYPEGFDRWTRAKTRMIYAASARRATAVSTVSEHSKRDMIRFYRMHPERVHVVPEGVDVGSFRPLADPARAARWRRSLLGADVPYLAYVGKPTERRNLTPMLRAYAELKRRRAIPHRFVIAGADLPGTSPFRRTIDELGIAGDVVVRGYVSHDDMPMLYNAADALLYPSSYEGFGMPVLEAMACGTPVLALDNTAFPEFAAGVALLLPDARVETLRGGIETLLADGAMRERMRRDGPERARGYDWKIVTRRYLDLMRPLLGTATR